MGFFGDISGCFGAFLAGFRGVIASFKGIYGSQVVWRVFNGVFECIAERSRGFSAFFICITESITESFPGFSSD